MAFDFNYVSTFRVDPGPTGNPPVGFFADTDTNQAGEGPILGDMKAWASPDITINGDASGGGFVVGFTNPTHAPASANIYVVTPLDDFGDSILNRAPNLLAELEFDSPQFMNSDGNPTQLTPWTVALNFKTGNENDLPSDSRIGARFTFIGGAANFRGAKPVNKVLGTYADFAGTRFTLRVSIQRTETTFESGAMAFVGDAGSSGPEGHFIGLTDVNTDSTILKFGLSLNAARNAGAKITAAGVSVVNNGQDGDGNPQPPSQVSVHLIAFRLAWDFPKPVLTSIPPV
jgi:hypothetical protein